MKTLQDYITDFQHIWDGAFWASGNYKDTFKNLSPIQATTKPLPKLHSIAELVWHIAAWRKVMIEHLKGNTSYDIVLNTEADWKIIPEGDVEAWEEALADLQETQAIILKLLSESEESTLNEVYKKKYTRTFLINGIIQHDIYHLGQIRMLKGLVS